MAINYRRIEIQLLPALIGLIIGLAVIFLIAVRVHARSDIRGRNRECGDEAAIFKSESRNFASTSKVVGYAAHYNMQRHQCLVEITSSRPEDGAESDNEQIFDPRDGSFIASRDSVAGVRTARAIVTGAPVPVHQEIAAQAWFNDLMRK